MCEDHGLPAVMAGLIFCEMKPKRVRKFGIWKQLASTSTVLGGAGTRRPRKIRQEKRRELQQAVNDHASFAIEAGSKFTLRDPEDKQSPPPEHLGEMLRLRQSFALFARSTQRSIQIEVGLEL